MDKNSKCGLCGISPRWLQNWATSRTFMIVYALLGAVQKMASTYIIVTLTTLEKRFKIPSQTIGILLSGPEISQVFAIFLIYYGGSGHRPRWIAATVAINALCCLVLIIPHIVYGPGPDALALTKEYFNQTLISNSPGQKNNLAICSEKISNKTCDETVKLDSNIVPGIIFFFSQFIMGIGSSLYYGLGQAYMDDNTKKKNTPMMLGLTFALRMIGPTLGFALSYFCLNYFIEPSLHPLISKDDPRWLGAWWLGWIILGITMLIFALLLTMFPRELQKSKNLSSKESVIEPLKLGKKYERTQSKEPTLYEFPKTMKRLLTNKILMFNTFSEVFYIISATGVFNFLAKYLEIQYQTSSGGGAIITGPLMMMGIVFGFIISGAVISKFKPSARSLMAWNIFIRVFYILGLILSIFLKCDGGEIEGLDKATSTVNLTAECNVNCNCHMVKYSPVCHQGIGKTFFSACHAGCKTTVNDTTFGNCSCLEMYDSYPNLVTAGPCRGSCFVPYFMFSVVIALINIIANSGRIGNILVSYRCVEVKDKSLAQGLSFVFLSIFALIPAPIIFGSIVDYTCLIWDMSCNGKGNCWLYDKDNFRYYINFAAAVLSVIGVFFDIALCYFTKNLDLYEDGEEKVTQIKLKRIRYKKDAEDIEE